MYIIIIILHLVTHATCTLQHFNAVLLCLDQTNVHYNLGIFIQWQICVPLSVQVLSIAVNLEHIDVEIAKPKPYTMYGSAMEVPVSLPMI